MASLILSVTLGISTQGVAMALVDQGDHVKLVSNIKKDENIVFFRTAAWLDVSTNTWHVPIHAWVYEPQDSRWRKSAFAKTFKYKYGIIPDKAQQANFDARVNWLISDNERNKSVVVELLDQKILLPKTTSQGHAESIVEISADQLQHHDSNILSYRAILPDDDQRVFIGEVVLVPPNGISVISDIDDTIKITEVTERARLLHNTFLEDFSPVEGMADAYTNAAFNTASEKFFTVPQFHYVSSSPWYLYVPLVEFLQAYEFPYTSLHLKAFRFRDKSITNLFKKGTETKPLVIETLLQQYPQRSFYLVGDSGEEDAHVYAAMLRQHPGQIIKAYIRNIDGSEDVQKHIESIFSGIDASKWKVFSSAQELNFSLPEVEKPRQ